MCQGSPLALESCQNRERGSPTLLSLLSHSSLTYFNPAFSLCAIVYRSAMSHSQIDKIVTEQNLSKLLPYLKKQSNDSLAAVSTHDPLDQLNPAVHSLGYLFVLYVANRVPGWY